MVRRNGVPIDAGYTDMSTAGPHDLPRGPDVQAQGHQGRQRVRAVGTTCYGRQAHCDSRAEPTSIFADTFTVRLDSKRVILSRARVPDRASPAVGAVVACFLMSLGNRPKAAKWKYFGVVSLFLGRPKNLARC